MNNDAQTPAVISPAARAAMQQAYSLYHRRDLVHPDPLEFVYNYERPGDREIAALVAASLAFGRVTQILRSVRLVLDRMEQPAAFVRRSSESAIRSAFKGFKHRWADGREIGALLVGVKHLTRKDGSLRACFMNGVAPGDGTTLPALARFAEELVAASGGQCPSLVSSPRDGSACKRMNLFLRWMVRHDEVDPGGWEAVGAWRLVAPVDVHMFRLCRAMGMTARRQADGKAAIEITEAFRTVEPEDPVKYDFALSRLGIRNDADPVEFLARFGLSGVRS